MKLDAALTSWMIDLRSRNTLHEAGAFTVAIEKYILALEQVISAS